MLINSNTILLLDLIIIIIIKYCNINIKIDDNFKKLIKSNKKFDYIVINKTKSNKLINFLLEQLNIIYKSKDFKILKSNIKPTNKTYPIQNLKNWLSAIYIELNSLKYESLFSNHFKIDTKIKDLDLTKGYQSYINFIINLKKNKIKYDLKESNNKNISKIFNLLFYPFKNTKNGGGKSNNEKKTTLSQKTPTLGVVKAIKKSQNKRRLSTPWQKLISIIDDSTKSKDLFLEILRNKLSQEKKYPGLLKVLSLKQKDLENKDAFVKYWMNYFKETIKDGNQQLFNDIIKVMDNEDDISKFDALIEQTKDLTLEQKNLIYLALLARLWTHRGNEWIYELVVQHNPTDKYADITTNFTHIYETNLKEHILLFVGTLDTTKYGQMLLECEYNKYIVENNGNIGQKYMCILSFLARYYCDIVNTAYFSEYNIPHLDIYFGTDQKFIDKLNSKTTAFEIAQSTSWSLETAVDFARRNEQQERQIVVYRIDSEIDNLIFSCFPIDWLSIHGYEQEILGVPRSPFALRSIDHKILAGLKTLTVSDIERNLQEPFQKELTAKTKTSQDLMDLGYEDINFTFMNFNSQPEETKTSFSATAMVIIAKNKFKIKKGPKTIDLEELGNLGDWEQFF
tara:strand:+ start:629 stop:2500 length:1872 start_codon:yes stop_codon:yes gene_type:complete